jgi:hypothetical protein
VSAVAQPTAIVLATFVVLGCSTPPVDPGSGASGAAGAGGQAGATSVSCVCPAGAPAVVHLPLACQCQLSTQGNFYCTRSLADVRADARCADGETDVRAMGCSKISYALGGGYTGSVIVFSTQADAVVGVYQHSDTPSGPCLANDYVYGEGLFPLGTAVAAPADTCAQFTSCALCGTPTSTTPACP